jgi:hypothetical protein
MKRIIVTVPYGQQITEDHWIKKHISKEFDEDSTVGDILRFIDTVKDADISSSLITVLPEPY